MRRRLPLLATAAGAVVLIGAFGLGAIDPLLRRLDMWTDRPRVLAGADAFETVSVTERAGARQTGEFDGEPGDDLALVEYDHVRLLTPATLVERRRLEIGGDLRSRWGPSFLFARIGGALVVVDSGGGLDDARLLDLDGTERWRYRSDTGLPATSLVPADLDGDGDAELYATLGDAALRLDGRGQESWRVPFSGGRIVATAARTRRDPAWIVAEGQGETVVWDGTGMPLASLRMKDARPLSTIEWSDGRYLLAGGPALRAVALDGRVVFEWTVPDMLVSAAMPVALDASAPPAVAVVSAGRGDGGGWRLQIVERNGVSREGRLLYDERLATSTALLTARGPDGVDRLFLDDTSLVALRKRTP